MAFCCTVQRSSVLVVKRPEVLCCRQRSFSSFQNLHRTSSLLLKHPVSNKQSTRESRSFWFCRRKAVFALSKAELRQAKSFLILLSPAMWSGILPGPDLSQCPRGIRRRGRQRTYIFRTFSDPVILFWHQDFSGATVGIQAFI